MAETLPTQLPQDGGEEGQAASINQLPDEASPAQSQTLVLLADSCQQPSVNNASHLSPQSVVSANSSNKSVLPIHSDGASTSESPPHNSSPAAASQPDPSLGKASISLKKSSDTDTSQIKDTSDNRTENGSVCKEVSTDKKAIEVSISNPKEMASLITDCIERHQTLNSPLSGDSSVSACALVKENPLVCVPVKQKSPIPSSENPPNVTGSPSAKPLISSILSEKASNAVTVPKENASHPSKSPLDELSVQSSLEMKKSVNNSAGDVKVTASADLNNAEEKEISRLSLMPRATDALSCDSKNLASSRPQEQLSALPPVSSTSVVSSGSSSSSLPPVSLCSSSLQNSSISSPHMSSKSPESMDSSAFTGSSETLLKTASNTSALMEGVQSTSITVVQESHASSSTSSVPMILEKPKEDGSLTSISDGQVEKNGKNECELTDSTNSSETVHKSGESKGCENKSNSKTEKELLPSANSLSNRDSQGICSGIDMTNDNASGDCWNESSLTSASTEAFPLIDDSCSLPKNPTSCSLKEMEPKPSSPQVLKKVAVGASSGDSEPLQPVTIGGSLQPLEEVQEASLLDDPSYSADLALLDSSADEADSIGGLVINSVIGAADGVAAFHPDDEKETDRELTDISTSAPQIVEESCDIDSSEETGPSPKKMRLENGDIEMDDKLQDSRKVVIKVAPLKNGNGLWDAQKLRDVLLSKGSVLLQLHISNDSIEICEVVGNNKSDEAVDFTGIMIEVKDEEQDQILGLATLDPDGDTYDPLALGAVHSVEQASPPHYTRTYPSHPRGRSTALQPAMSRPGYKHLQSPPHYYMKNEVLGLPQPLEFEEPQFGASDWSGLASPTVASPEPQHPPPLLTTSARPHIKPKVKKSQSRVIKMKKVCEQCGKAFNKSHKYMQHLRIHRPVLQCDKCNFKTKDVKKFRNHDISHKKKNPEVRCNFCNELFATAVTKMIHKKKIHNMYECKHCSVDWNTEDQLMDHLRDEHGFLDKKRKGYIHQEEIVDVKPINIFLDPPPPTCDKELVCRLCNKETRNKYQLKIHIGQHLGVPSSKISDEFLLTQDVEKFEFDTQLPSTSQGMQELNFEMKGRIKLEPVDEVEHPEQLPVSEDSNSSRSTTPGGIPSAKDSSHLLHQSKHSSSLAYSANDSEHDSDEYLDSFMEESDNVNPAEKFFKCLFCNLCFSNPKYLKIHLVTVHARQNPSSPPKRRRQMVACDTCGKEFRSQKVMRKHQKAKHRKTFSCPECNVSHYNIYRLLRHQKISHKNKLRCRYQCTALFDTEEECNDHYRYFHNKETTNLSCPYCGMEYKYEGFLINHLDICKDCPPDRRPVHVCGNCDAVLPNQKDYTIHVRTCKVWKPTQEVKKTRDSQTLSSGPLRVRDIGGEAGGKCVRPVITSRVKKEKLGNDCTTHENGDSDSSASTIRGNVTEAQNSRKQSHFIKGSSFQEGPQKCIYCPDRFESRIEAINHILAMHKNLITRMVTEPQLCSVCGMVFKNPLCLCKHISKHFCDLGMWDSLVPRNILNIVKTESFCWVCNCKLRGKLRHHLTLRNDTIDRALSVNCKGPDDTTPFQCSKCNDSFLSRSSFWDHVKLHLSRLPKHSKQGEQSSLEDSIDNSVVSECSECLLKFTDREELYTHLASHFIEPYVEDPDSPEWKPYATGRSERQGDGEPDTDEL